MQEIAIDKGKKIVVEYEGRLESGEVFDSSTNQKGESNPLTFTIGLKQVIPGFEEETQKMSKGEEKEFKIHSEKAYGSQNPELKKERTIFSKYINNNFMARSGKFMAGFTKLIHDNKKCFTLILAHNEILQMTSFDHYKTMGFRLRNMYGPKYKCIGTASNEGYIKYIGEIDPIYKLYKQPKPIKFIDKGTLFRYLSNNFNLKSSYSIF